MLYDSKILVVGTTPDYIEIIRRVSGGRAVFITEPDLRRKASEPCPDGWEELLSDFKNQETLIFRLDAHLKKYGFSISGVTAFDCESLLAASFIAEKLKLPFVSAQAVKNCRDKFISKKLWKAAGVKTPAAEIVNSLKDALDFFRRAKGRSVIKPRTGAGSELVFLCSDESEVSSSYDMIDRELKTRSNSRLYDMRNSSQIIMEEFIEATEFSADFAIRDGNVKIIRLTQKIKRTAPVFGITSAYLLLNTSPGGTDTARLEETFLKSCIATGINNAICMMDFFVKDGDIFLLETAPRPGGDCIPFLLEKATGLNILKAALDFSVNPETSFPDFSEAKPCMGIRIIADKAGLFEAIDTSRLEKEKNIKSIYISTKAGSEIFMPPEDYDSWILGYIIAEREKSLSPEQQVTDTLDKVYCKILNK